MSRVMLRVQALNVPLNVTNLATAIYSGILLFNNVRYMTMIMKYEVPRRLSTTKPIYNSCDVSDINILFQISVNDQT